MCNKGEIMKNKINKKNIVPFTWGIDWIDNAVVDTDDDNPLGEMQFKIGEKDETPPCYVDEWYADLDLASYENSNMSKSEYAEILKKASLKYIDWLFDELGKKEFNQLMSELNVNQLAR